MSVEEKFLDDMIELNEVQYLNIEVPLEQCCDAELHLAGATGSDFKNTAVLEVVNCEGMMNSAHRELLEEGIFGCWKKVLKTDLKPGGKKFDSTWSSRLKPGRA